MKLARILETAERYSLGDRQLHPNALALIAMSWRTSEGWLWAIALCDDVISWGWTSSDPDEVIDREIEELAEHGIHGDQHAEIREIESYTPSVEVLAFD